MGRRRRTLGWIRITLGINTQGPGARGQHRFFDTKPIILLPRGQLHALSIPLLELVQLQRRYYMGGVVAFFVLSSQGGRFFLAEPEARV